MTINRLTRQGRAYADALEQVRGGADVYDYGLARTLREIERCAPELIEITKAATPPSGEKRQPYFGAIVTSAGKDWLDGSRHD